MGAFAKTFGPGAPGFAIGLLLLLGFGGCAAEPAITDAQVNTWAKAVADLDARIEFHGVTKPQEHMAHLAALRLMDHPTDPLNVWAKLEPLLRLKHPDAVQFQKMHKLTGYLGVLSAMFSMDEEYSISHEDLLHHIRDLHGKIYDWQSLEGQPL